MRIAVNTRLLLPGKLEGLGRFACETLRRITQWHPEHEFLFIFDRKYDREFIFSDNIIPVVAFPQARHPILWYLFFDWGIPPVLKKYKPDIFLSPDGWLSLRTQIPSISVIHDLNFFHEPQWIETLPRYYYNYFFPRFIRKAGRIATVSEYSANDISSQFGIPRDTIDVIYNGAGDNLVPVNEPVKQATREKYTRGCPYFLFLGLVHPRKNLTCIIEAFNRYKKTANDKTRLLVAGSTKYRTADTKSAFELSPFREDIVFTDRLPESELMNVLGSCQALVYASLFEGFGIPILEAMHCGVPVITSNVTSMPEVGGDAVYYVNPHSADSISEGMLAINRDEKLRADLIRKGFEQKKKFSWDRTAKGLWKCIETTFNNFS